MKTWVRECNLETAAVVAELNNYASAHKGPGAYYYTGLHQVRGMSEGMVKGGPLSSSPRQPRPSRQVSQKSTCSKVQPSDKVQVVCYNCGEAAHIQPNLLN